MIPFAETVLHVSLLLLLAVIVLFAAGTFVWVAKELMFRDW